MTRTERELQFRRDHIKLASILGREEPDFDPVSIRGTPTRTPAEHEAEVRKTQAALDEMKRAASGERLT
jgi:hypothetical protein